LRVAAAFFAAAERAAERSAAVMVDFDFDAAFFWATEAPCSEALEAPPDFAFDVGLDAPAPVDGAPASTPPADPVAAPP